MQITGKTRPDRVRQRIKNQRARLDKVDKAQRYTTIPWPVVEETNEEYMQRITDMNLRVAIAPLEKILVQHELQENI